MLVLLLRGNPDAFTGKNMNRLKTGKIIKLPPPDQYGSVAQADARKEVLVQARDWHAYREQLAAKAGGRKPPPEPAQQAAARENSGKGEDQGGAREPQTQEMLKPSQSQPAAARA